jgi:hypothetical protein
MWKAVVAGFKILYQHWPSATEERQDAYSAGIHGVPTEIRTGCLKNMPKALLYLLFYWTANGFPHGESVTAIRQNTQIHISHKITHHAQAEHSIQSYTNIKGHITHNEYNTNK